MSTFRARKWRPDGPVRTNTGSSIRGRISAPIMVEDDEFPIRLPGTGIATPLGDEGMEKQLQLRSSVGSAQILQPDRTVSSDFEDAPRASPPPPQPSHEPPPHPANQQSAIRNSMVGNPSGPNEGKPQRKKSSLGSVFRKIFGGRKRKDSSPSSKTGPKPDGFRAGQHRSDPTALNRNPKDTSLTQKRSASLPINEFNRALRSHSIVIDDFPAYVSAHRNSMQANGQTRPRRATTPSRLWATNKTPGIVDWGGLSPRPASTHGRDSKIIGNAEADAAVGIAITSGSHPNRRSRSLGELRGTVPANITVRRRSDEIKYWRESYDPGLLSPMSSNKAETEEPILLELPEMPQDELPQEAPQPFNFGPMGDMAGMKITQAASLESRVQILEVRTLQMQKIVSQMHYGMSRGPDVIQDPPQRYPERERSTSMNRPKTDSSEICLPKQPRCRELRQLDSGPQDAQVQSSSYGSSRPSTISTQNSYNPSFDNFSHPTLHSSEKQMPVNTNQTVTRPLSTSTTIRGISLGSSTMPKDAPLTGEHFTAFTNMIIAEQTARQHLEAIVQNLQQQLQDIRLTGAGSCPTPDPDLLSDPVKENAARQLSTFEQDDSSDDEGRYAQNGFQTPNEERDNFSDDIFGDVNDGDMKGAPRKLSLSQMTTRRRDSANFEFLAKVF